MKNIERISEVAHTIVTRITPVFVESYAKRNLIAVTEKKDGGQVGAPDIESNRIFEEELSRAWPRTEILGEEGRQNWPSSADEAWDVDPFDGTDNFLGGFMISSAMATYLVDGIVMGVMILLPFEHYATGEGIYVAARGEGAFAFSRDGSMRRMYVSAETKLDRAFIAIEGSSRMIESIPAKSRLGKIARRNRAVFGAGQSAVAVADGAYNPRGVSALIAFNNAHWDNLPAFLVEEAGGRVTDHAGNPITVTNYTDMVASNGLVHDEVLDVINHRRSEG